MKREPHWVKLFFRELARTGNVQLAAERAGRRAAPKRPVTVNIGEDSRIFGLPGTPALKFTKSARKGAVVHELCELKGRGGGLVVLPGGGAPREGGGLVLERAGCAQRAEAVDVEVDQLEPAVAGGGGDGAGRGGHLLARAAAIISNVGFHHRFLSPEQRVNYRVATIKLT